MFYDDIWNVKYLSKFQWGHLTEKLAYDQKMREQRLKSETANAKKELQFYEQKRDLSKKLNKIEETRIKAITRLDEKASGAATEDERLAFEKKKEKNLEKIFKYSKKREAEQFTHTLPRLIHQNLQVALTFLLVKTPVSSEK